LIDHHKSGVDKFSELNAKRSENSNYEIIFDMNHSAAKLAWKKFNGDVPCFIADYIEDRDLYLFKLPNSKAINSGLSTGKYYENFWNIEALYQRWKIEPDAVINELVLVGNGSNSYQAKIVEEIALKACPCIGKFGTLDNYKEYKVLVVHSAGYTSDVGDILMKEVAPFYIEKGWVPDFACMWNYSVQQDKIFISMRTTRNDVDLSKISKCPIGGLPGGGHPKASAFSIEGCNIKAVFETVNIEFI